jgi:nitrate reductase (cytochrome), electron transfer subunit
VIPYRVAPAKLLLYLLLLGSAASAVVAVVALSRRPSTSRDDLPENIPLAAEIADVEPIPSEAGVFRTQLADLAIDPTSETRRGAHPRTLATYRGLRAYPGAPPRIPHGLTPAETLRGGCKTCHERGGYSQRFGAYVPVTPHPEMGQCLQCHVGDSRLLATPLPSTDPSARCRQCHSAGGMLWKDSASNFKPLPWQQLARVSGEHTPPPIPHTLELRGNCLSCHSAPAGVKEIRTSHPERANCRQCHLETTGAADEFVRPQQAFARRNKGAP